MRVFRSNASTTCCSTGGNAPEFHDKQDEQGVHPKPAGYVFIVFLCEWFAQYQFKRQRPKSVGTVHLLKIWFDCLRTDPRIVCSLFVGPASIESMMDRFSKVTHGPLNHRKSSLFNRSLRLEDLSFHNLTMQQRSTKFTFVCHIAEVYQPQVSDWELLSVVIPSVPRLSQWSQGREAAGPCEHCIVR